MRSQVSSLFHKAQATGRCFSTNSVKPANPLLNLFKAASSATPRTPLLDGGITTSLPEPTQKHALWGHQVLFGLDGGVEALAASHRRFLECGADVIGSMTYKLSHEFLLSVRDHGLTDELPEGDTIEAEELYRRALGASKTAIEDFWAANTDPERLKPLLFASCGEG